MMDGSLFEFPPLAEPVREDIPLIVDSFAGGGGASTGIELALGRSPDIAINHSEAALALHAANHPKTLHLSENVYHVDPLHHMHGRHIGLMWFSPDCKDFSKAKGGAPVRRNIRDLAWIIPGWIERIQKSGGCVDVVLMENVEEFKGWGPVIHTPKGLSRDPERIGETFKAWCKKLRSLGGRIQWRELRGCDYGEPTIRKRLFIVMRFDGQPIVWPKPTHSNPKSAAVKRGKLKPWRIAAECIDFSLPCPSIFDTKAEIMDRYGLRAQRPLASNTLARVARGTARYVLGEDRPFTVQIGAEESAAPSLTRFNSGATGSDMRDPAPTVTANSWIKKPGGAAPLGMIAPLLATMRNSQKPWQGADEPTHTVTAGGAGLSLIAPNLMSLKGTARRDCAANAPHPTVLAGGGHSALIAPVLTYAQQGGSNRSVEQPHHTICANSKDQNGVIIPTLIQTGYGEREGQAPRVLDIAQPLGTIVAGGVKHATCAAFLAQQNGGPRMDQNAGRDLRDPMSTVTATGSQQNTVAAFLAKYYGTGDGARLDEPAHTVTTHDRFGHVQAQISAPPFAAEHHARAREVAEFLRAYGAWNGGEFVTVTIDGTEFVIVDIGMRMLTPRELFNAQGFPPDYVIDGVWDQGTGWENIGHNGGPRFIPFPKHVQVSCCGNSVCPGLARALIAANCQHLIIKTEKEVANA